MKRSYKQNCSLAHAMDVIGERWTLLIVRELLIGPRRYGELLENLVGIGTNLLASRLKELEGNGLVEKADSQYSLTDTGLRLEPVVWEIVRFGLGLGIGDDEDRLTRSEWDAVALRALYSADKDSAVDGRYVVELNGAPFVLDKQQEDPVVSPGDTDRYVARVSLSKDTARALASGRTSYSDSDIVVEGSKREGKKLLRALGIVPR
jgi:DNA-binding HxlR family transcriptional regulator